jgi:putative ABC transport system permease protein
MVFKTEQQKVLKDYAFRILEVNDSFFGFYQLKYTNGGLPKDTSKYKSSVVINETAALKLGWTGNAVGRRILISNFSDSTKYDSLYISGVIRDFNFASFHNTVEPLISIKSTTAASQSAIPIINQTARELGLKTSLNCIPLEDTLKQQYTVEQKLAELISIFAFLSVFIAAIGLLGLSSFTTEKMSKENGVRKVLGATQNQIAISLYKEMFIPVIIAYCIAVPLAWIITRIWLSGFAFHYNAGPAIFIATAFLTLLWTLCAMSFHILRSSLAKPFEAIKYE